MSRLKIKTLFKQVIQFFESNIFVFITGLLIVFKMVYFNVTFDLLNEKIVLAVVSTVLVGCMMAPFIFFPEKRIKYSMIFNIVLSCIIFSDSLYIRYFSSLMSLQSIFYASELNGVSRTIVGLMKPTDIVLFVDIPLLYFIFKRLRERGVKFFEMPSKMYLNFAFLGFCFFSLVFITSFDFKNVKLLTTRVYDNRVTAERYSLTGYHILDIYRFARNSFVHLSQQEKDQAIKDAKRYIPSTEKNEKTAIAKGKTVYLIQVESLQSTVINQKIDGQEITPNVNKLIKESDYFSNHYFQIGSGGTADTDFTINSGLYPLRDASTFVQYGKDSYTGVATDLAKNGYSTYAYHGFNRSFWNRNIALKSLGYQKFLAADSYQGLEKIQMGVSDEAFLGKTADYLKTEKSPSFNYIITLTSHLPFKLPEGKKELKLNSKYPDSLSNYYQSIHYADKSLGEFIDKLKAEGLYQDSLIVLYGDHSANVGDIEDQKVSTALGLGSVDEVERAKLKKVPLIIHLPEQIKGNEIAAVSGHLDVAPTLLNLLGVKSSSPMFGRDLYGMRDPFFAAVHYFGGGFIETDSYAYFDGPTSGLENGHCYLIQDKKNWKKIGTQNCESMVEKRDSELNLSEKLIKYNLIKEIN